MIKVMAKNCLNTAASRQVSSTTDADFEIGDKILEFREDQNIWAGTCKAVDVKGKVAKTEYDD